MVFRGFYTAASGMLTQMHREQMLTNNLTNMNTTGYKADRAATRAFPKMLMERTSGEGTGSRMPIGGLATGTYLQETMPKFSQGDLKETGNNTDVALLQTNVPDERGSLFFAVQNADGDLRYTRNGDFTVDARGRLTDNHGNLVLDMANRPITVADHSFTVAEDGTVTSAGQNVGQLQVAYSADAMNLAKDGGNLYRLDGDAPLPTADGQADIRYQIKQKFLERANVDGEQAMTALMNAFRNLQANQKVVQAYDSTMDKAVNQVGRLR